MTDYNGLLDRVRAFGVERDWKQFHDPKSLLIALMGEVGEVAELLQWVPAAEATSRVKSEPLAPRVAEELADVFIYLLQLADACEVDLIAAGDAKLTAAVRKYPVAESRGRAPDRLQ